MRSMPDATHMLFDFADESARTGWRSVDDVVMGGVSDSDLLVASPQTAAFEGDVSLDHGGGFASVRSPDRLWDLSGFDGLLVRARGDGKRYKLTLYMGSTTSISYRFPFTASATWTDHFAPFGDLVPMRRGRRVPDAPEFNPAAVSTVGFLISDRQAGPFQLELRWIQAATRP